MGGIVYFTGMHGSGKSTLINALVDAYPGLRPTEKISIPKSKEIRERNMLRYSRSYIHRLHDEEFVREHQEAFLLRDRFWLDEQAYVLGFLRLGWIREQEYSEYLQLQQILFGHVRDMQIVFVNPPVAYLQEKIRERWAKTGTKKWREDNFAYLETVRDAFPEVLAQAAGETLDLVETDLEARVKRIGAWLGVGAEEKVMRAAK